MEERNKEMKIMKNLKHPNVVEYVDYFEFDHSSDILIMEFCQV